MTAMITNTAANTNLYETNATLIGDLPPSVFSVRVSCC